MSMLFAALLLLQTSSVVVDNPLFKVVKKVFEERLELNDTRPRHSHNQRMVIVLNKSKLHQQPEGEAEFVRDNTPGDIRFTEAIIHTVKNVGETPLRAIIIELKP